MMHGHEKSDSVIVAAKPANKAERSAAELVEPRAETKGNAGWQSTLRTQSRACGSQALARMRQAFAVRTRGGSRMRESRTYGFVRGALSNERPYRVAARPRVRVGSCVTSIAGPHARCATEGLTFSRRKVARFH